jgi:hypothetical protein
LPTSKLSASSACANPDNTLAVWSMSSRSDGVAAGIAISLRTAAP